MDKLIINGGHKLFGDVQISGAKNAVLPIMTATLIVPGNYKINNVPDLRDTRTMIELLKIIGANVQYSNNTLLIDTKECNNPHAPYDLVKTMRASFYVLGPLLSRFHQSKVSLPGGCAWGPRPVDFHIKALREMKVDVRLDKGDIIAQGQPQGHKIHFTKNYHSSITSLFDERLELEFDIDAIPALSERRRKIYENVVSAVNAGIMSRNEARAAVGLEPKDGADDLLVPATLFPLGDESVPEPPKPVQEADMEDYYDDEEDDEDEEDMDEAKKNEASHGDDEEEDEDEDEKEESKKESYDMSDDIDALVGGEDLSEEFKSKAKVVFEAALSAKVSEIKEELESQKRDEIVEASNEIKEDLTNKVDSFLGYVAEEWVKDNELAIERGLKSELTENFIQGLKALFEDHYVEVPDDKLDVVDELASKIEDVEAKLNEEVSKNIDLTSERDELVRNKVVSEVSSDLTTSEVEKLTKLIEDLDADDEFESNVKTIKESYFSGEKSKLQLDEEVVSDSDENTSTDDIIVDPSMAAYSAAIGKVDPNKYK